MGDTTEAPRQPLDVAKLLTGWGRLLRGHSPLLSIEVTRECPLNCPGCYAYGDNHLGGGLTLRGLSDLRGDALIERVLALIQKHRPMQVSFVGGEPLVRHKELSRILPALSQQGVYSLVVTSAVIPFPESWNALPRVRVTVSIDGLQPEHDARRKPATYERILKNLEGRSYDISWVVTNQMMARAGYLEEYLAFWRTRPGIGRIWLSMYTPQRGEISTERLTPASRARLFEMLPDLKREYPALVLPDGAEEAFAAPPRPGLVYVCTDLGELFGRSRDADPAVLLWREPGLLAVRLRRERRPALDPQSKDRRRPHGRTPHRRVARHWTARATRGPCALTFTCTFTFTFTFT